MDTDHLFTEIAIMSTDAAREGDPRIAKSSLSLPRQVSLAGYHHSRIWSLLAARFGAARTWSCNSQAIFMGNPAERESFTMFDIVAFGKSC